METMLSKGGRGDLLATFENAPNQLVGDQTLVAFLDSSFAHRLPICYMTGTLPKLKGDVKEKRCLFFQEKRSSREF